MSYNYPNNYLNLLLLLRNRDVLRWPEQREYVGPFKNLSVYYKEKFMELYEIEDSMIQNLTVMLNKANAKCIDTNVIEYAIKSEMRLEDIVHFNDKICTMSKRIYQRIQDIHIPDTISHENTLELYKLEKDITKYFFGLFQVKGLKHKNMTDYLSELKFKIAKKIFSKKLLGEKRITNMALRIIQCVSDSIFDDSSKYANLVVLDEETRKKVHTPNCLDNEFDQILNQIYNIEYEFSQTEKRNLLTGDAKLLSIGELIRKIKRRNIHIPGFDDFKMNSMATRIYERVQDMSKIECDSIKLKEYYLENRYTKLLLEQIKRIDILKINAKYIKKMACELITRNYIKNTTLCKQKLIANMTNRVAQRVHDALLCYNAYQKIVRAGSY